MALNQSRVKFIAQHKDDVINATIGTGIFPSVKMAQMILESSDSMGIAGNGITARLANNYFGIKADQSWKGSKMFFNTPKDGQPVNYFRVYPTVKDSIEDHTHFLKHNSRYAKAGVFNAQTPSDQAQALENAGYAENSDYARTLEKIISDYHLTNLDDQQAQKKKS